MKMVMEPSECPPVHPSSLRTYSTELFSVAGIAGADQYGVAPWANLINVKVLDKDGYGRRLRDFAQAIIDITAENWPQIQK